MTLTRQRAWATRRVALLPRSWGERLTQLGALWEQIRWIAAPPDLADQELRFVRLAALLEAVLPRSAWIDLQAEMPKTGRHAEGARRRKCVR